MVNAFIQKMESLASISDADREWLRLASSKPKDISADTDIIHEGDAPSDVNLILEGFACRYKSTTGGDRQIFAYLVPGDFCDLQVALLKEMDHSIATLSPCKLVKIPKRTVLDLMRNHPVLIQAFWLCSLVDEATLREWVLNVGQRSAELRIAHLFCELHVRLQVVGLTSNGSFDLPISQTELADTVGLSQIHVNRSLRALRQADLVTFKGKTVRVPDIERLKAYAGFKPNYLHIRPNTTHIS